MQHDYTTTVQLVVAVSEADPAAAKAAISDLLEIQPDDAGHPPQPIGELGVPESRSACSDTNPN